MALTTVEICNLALAQLGGKFIISSLDEETRGAQLCKTFYEPLRDAVLEDGYWSFARKAYELTVSAETSLIEGDYKYKLNPKSLTVIDVFYNGKRVKDWRMEGRFVITPYEGVIVLAVDRITDITLYSQSFVQALATRIAAELAMPLTNSSNMAQQKWGEYNAKVQKARTNDSLQGVGTVPSKANSRIIQARRGA